MAAYDLVDPKPGQRPAGPGDEHGIFRRRGRVALSEEFLELPSGLGPQGTHPPFVPFAVEADSGWGIQIQVPYAQLCYLLGTSPRVV
jgi:hypothetical protein